MNRYEDRLDDIDDSIYCHDHRITALDRKVKELYRLLELVTNDKQDTSAEYGIYSPIDSNIDKPEGYYWCPTCKKEPSGSAENTSTGKREVLICGECGTTYLEYRTKPEAEQKAEIHRCLDCGAEIKVDEDGGYYVNCKVSPISHTMGAVMPTKAEAIAAYNRLVEDRRVAKEINSWLEYLHTLRPSTRLTVKELVGRLQRIVKGGE